MRNEFQFIYPASLEKDEDGGFLVRFRDLPEALTEGADREEALIEARDCLEEALAHRMAARLEIPPPSRCRAGDTLIHAGHKIIWSIDKLVLKDIPFNHGAIYRASSFSRLILSDENLKPKLEQSGLKGIKLVSPERWDDNYGEIQSAGLYKPLILWSLDLKG